MSTKMYNYRIAKERWWPFAKACREHYAAEHPIPQVLRKFGEDGGGGRTYKKMMDAIESLVDKDWTVDLQLFDEGDTYIIRPLERGYFFMNQFDQWAEFDLERVYYDNRSDVPPEDEKNEAVAKWVDAKIFDNEYLTFTVLNRDDFRSICFDTLLSKNRAGAPSE